MLTLEQQKAIENMLKVIDDIDYNTVNDYYSDLEMFGYSYDYVDNIKLLLFEFKLINRINGSNYEIKPNSNGYKVLNNGIYKYLKELEEKENDTNNANKATIQNVPQTKIGNYIAIMALLFAIIMALFPLLKNRIVNSKVNVDTNTNSRHNNRNNAVSISNIDTTVINNSGNDTIYIKKLK